jgi:phage terminase small subunit
MSRLDEMTLLRSVNDVALEAEIIRRRSGGKRKNNPNLSAQAAAVVRQGSAIEVDESISAHTIESFCNAYQISRSALYDAWSRGEGPRFFRLGTARRISVQAGRDWVGRLEQRTVQTPVDGEAAA